MTRHSLLLRHAVGALLLATLACNGSIPEGSTADTTTVSSALATATSHIIVPAYFGSTSTDWATLSSGPNKLPAGSIVIAPYPGGYDSDLYTDLANLHQNGVIVLGYAAAGRNGDHIDYTSSQAYFWSFWYGGMNPQSYGAAVIDGIFYDEAQRSFDDDIPKMLYLANYIRAPGMSFASNPPYVMFNLSVPYLEHNYVDCLLQNGQSAGNIDRMLFISQENSEGFYLGSTNQSNWTDPSWTWINSYKPTHFAHVLHDATTATSTTDEVVGDLYSTIGARPWNAAYVYATDGQFGYNEYGQLANASIYTELLAHTNSSHTNFGGATTDSLTSSCPAACEQSDTTCWCAHTECSTGDVLDSRCSPCATSLCAADPYCCSTYWDDICVGEVSSYCSAGYQCS